MSATHVGTRDWSSLLGYFYVVTAGVLWGLQWPMSRFCQAQDVPPLEIAFWRACIGGGCFLLHAQVTRRLTVRLRHLPIFCLFGVYAMGMQFAILQIAVRESGAALSSVLLYSAPVWVAIFSRLLFKETLSRVKLTALVIAIAGVAMICLSGGSLADKRPSTLGIGLGLLSGFVYASASIFFVLWKDRYSTSTIYAYMLLSGALALLPFVDVSPAKSAAAWGGLLVMGVLTCYGAFFAYGQSLRFISPVRVAIFCNLEPVVGTILCWLCWDESFPPIGWLGSALVIAAIISLAREGKNPTSRPLESER